MNRIEIQQYLLQPKIIGIGAQSICQICIHFCCKFAFPSEPMAPSDCTDRVFLQIRQRICPRKFCRSRKATAVGMKDCKDRCADLIGHNGVPRLLHGQYNAVSISVLCSVEIDL